jgi:hypothetical protein
MTSFTVTCGRENAGRFVAAAVRTPQVLERVLDQIGTEGKAKAVSIAPEHSGRYKDEIDFDVDGDQVTVGSKSKRAHLVEDGRDPGTAPPKALIAAIFDLPLDHAYRVAQRIGASGTQGAKVMETTRLAMQWRIPKIAAQVVRELEAR